MIEFDSTLALVVGLICGLFVGWKAAERFHTAMISDILERAGVTPEKLQSMMVELGKEMDEEVDEQGLTVVEIRIEQHNDTLYAYRKDNEEFLGQGPTKEALIERMGEKLRDVRLVVTPEDGAGLLGHQSFNYDIGKKQLSQE